MTIAFLKFQPKDTQIGIFGPKFRHFYFFHKILQLDKFKGVDFKYDNSFLKLLAQK